MFNGKKLTLLKSVVFHSVRSHYEVSFCICFCFFFFFKTMCLADRNSTVFRFVNINFYCCVRKKRLKDIAFIK